MASTRPFLLMVLLSAVILFGSLWFWTTTDDAISRSREQTLVASGITARIAELEQAVVPQVVWDEAVANLDVAFDPKWAQANIAGFFHQQSRIELAYVLDRNDRPVFGSESGAGVAPERFAPYAAAAAPLIAWVREAERRRPPLKPKPGSDEMIAAPIQSSTIERIGDHTYILTASLVEPDFGTVLPAAARAPIVVTGQKLDTHFLQRFAERFLIDNPRLEAISPAPLPRGQAAVALRNHAGQPIARIVWEPQRPGFALFTKALMPITSLLIGFSCLAVLLARDARKAAAGLMASEARARHIALHDVLTGLPNRLLFADRFQQAAAQLRRNPRAAVAVLCVDLDRFKDVNDTFGHNCGDELLRETARRLLETCRASDTVARLGGDEFAVIQSGGTAATAAAQAERLVQALSGPVDLSGGRVFLNCSVGVTLITDSAADDGEALRQADLALYRAKERGRAQYAFFEPAMDAAFKARKALEADLRGALAVEGLTMVYQPQVDGHGRMIGAEALVRWSHPERGAVPPGVFIPLAEECGLIEAVSAFTFRQAFLDSRRWPGLKVAVNVSARELSSPQFCDRLAALLRETGARAEGLELEITESAILGNDEGTRETLRQLRGMGFSLALDDFGTGYSSLSYLRLYPIDKIKIDRSFVVSLGAAPDAEAVVRAIVDLSRALGLAVIAEGVETREQHERLSAIGCTDAQGYLFSRPVLADEIDALLTPRATCAA